MGVPRAAAAGMVVALCNGCAVHMHPDRPGDGVASHLVVGTWDWAGRAGVCRDTWHSIDFSSDGRFLTFTFHPPLQRAEGPTRVVRYEVRSYSGQALSTFIVDPPETRRTDSGDLVAWDLVLFGRNTYRWHRTDWEPGAFTRKVIRCRNRPRPTAAGPPP
jgi:hypothetical protein